MENRLKGLRKSMEKTTFNQLNFSDHLRNQVHEKIKYEKEREEDIYLAILQILLNEKTGYELVQLLRTRGIQKFVGNEGTLYTLLHGLEKNNYLRSTWDDAGEKRYQINDKGRKILQKTEAPNQGKRFSLKELVEG